MVVGYAVGLMLLTRYRYGADRLKLNNEVAGFKYAVVGVLCAVLLALVVIAVWEDYSDTEDSVRDEAKAAIDAFAEKVIAKNVGAYLEIQGHTDNIGSESYNLKLGYKRAEQVMRYLASDKGFPLHRMNVTSYGEYKPIADNSTREGRAQNRRVALILMK